MQNVANNWMYTGVDDNPIYITFVSSNYGSAMDFYAYNGSYWSSSSGYEILAHIDYFQDGAIEVEPPENWHYVEIRLNDTALRADSVSNEVALGTVIHEMGHAFGLEHNNTNQYSIMCQMSFERKVQRVQKVDNDAINEIY